MTPTVKIAWAVGIAFVGSVSAQTNTLPVRTDGNVIVAAYNIQWLGQKPHDYVKLAEVIQHFDVCGIIEVKVETGVAELVHALDEKTGKTWGYTFGIRTRRPGGRYHEAYAAVWRRDRVQLGDGIISGFWDLEEAFRNDPYIVSFRRRNFDFSLILIHTRWSNDAEGTREGEVAMMAEQILWMQQFLKERDLILAGDFNYPGDAAPMKRMAEEARLVQLDPNHKSTFKRDYSGYASSYDHIYVPAGETGEYIAGSCQTLDVTDLLYGNTSKASMKKSKSELSDHLPVWAAFDVTRADDD